MKLIFVTLFLLILFQGCSFKSPKNQWEYNSTNLFASYTKSFLTNENISAKNDLERAIKYAKQSANLEQLARVYLGACALNISVGKNSYCKEYSQIEEFVSSKELRTYFLMLKKEETKEEIEYLPKQYRNFVEYKFEKKYDLAFESITLMEKETSQFIAASLIKNELNKSQVKLLIEKASFSGYKKIVLFWLKEYYNLEENLKEKELILKKIRILKN